MKPLNAGDTDVAIIGSGLGGLTSAILLGQLGFKTTVIERNPAPGGLVRSFTRQGIDCPVGLHYFGPAGKGELLRQMFDILGVTGDLRLSRLGTSGVLERYVFHDHVFDLPATISGFEEALRSTCPQDSDAIDTIVAAVRSLARGLRLDATGRLQANPFSFAGFNQSMEDFLRAAGASKKLHDIVSVHGFWTGLAMDACPAYLMLCTLGALLQSAWELGCTGTQMVQSYVARAQNLGAEFVLGDAAERILVADGHACGVQLHSGRTISCRKVIAGIHPKLALALLPEASVPADYRQGLFNLQETPGAVCARLLVEENKQPAVGHNLFCISAVTGAAVDGTFLSVRESSRPGWNMLTMIRGSAYSDWQPWHHTSTGSRGADYGAAKQRLAGSMIETAQRVLGDLGQYSVLDVSTPLTMRDRMASPEGSMYGLLRSAQTGLQYAVLTHLPVRSLYLVGQSAIAPGLLGVSLSVLRAVGEVAGRANFQNFLADRLAGLPAHES